MKKNKTRNPQKTKKLSLFIKRAFFKGIFGIAMNKIFLSKLNDMKSKMYFWEEAAYFSINTFHMLTQIILQKHHVCVCVCVDIYIYIYIYIYVCVCVCVCVCERVLMYRCMYVYTHTEDTKLLFFFLKHYTKWIFFRYYYQILCLWNTVAKKKHRFMNTLGLYSFLDSYIFIFFNNKISMHQSLVINNTYLYPF